MNQRSARILLFVWTAVIVSAVAAGCGKSDGPQVIPVTGTVTRNGKPVANAFLNFKPVQGRPSWAITDARGKYALEYDATTKGAVIGKHTVWVTQPISAAEGMGPEDQPKISADLSSILEKYGKEDSTPLKVEVKVDRPVIDLQLD